MASSHWLIQQTIDLVNGVRAPQIWPHTLMLQGDSNAHTWQVAVQNGSSKAPISGNVMGYFVRPDGNTVAVRGAISGNVASVTLAQACYAIEGDVQAVMRLTTNDATVTLSALILPVRRYLTDSIVDPGRLIPSLEDLLAQIKTMEQGTAAANAAAAAAGSAASNANSKAMAAQAAADAANTAASNANGKATAAQAAADAANTAASNASSKATAAQAAADAANTAASNANDKAAEAETAADAANTAASNAGSKATAAQAAAEAANTAASNASSKATAAQAAADAANTAASNANDKAAEAETAADAANTAAGNADDKAAAAQTAAEAANTAAGNADSKAEAAQTAAEAANTAAGNADDKAAAAQTAAEAANTAAGNADSKAEAAQTAAEAANTAASNANDKAEAVSAAAQRADTAAINANSKAAAAQTAAEAANTAASNADSKAATAQTAAEAANTAATNADSKAATAQTAAEAANTAATNASSKAAAAQTAAEAANTAATNADSKAATAQTAAEAANTAATNASSKAAAAQTAAEAANTAAGNADSKAAAAQTAATAASTAATNADSKAAAAQTAAEAANTAAGNADSKAEAAQTAAEAANAAAGNADSKAAAAQTAAEAANTAASNADSKAAAAQTAAEAANTAASNASAAAESANAMRGVVQDLAADVQRIDFKTGVKKYIVRWDKSNASCTRLGDAADITTDISHFAHRGSIDPDYSNPFDSLYPWSHRKLCKVDREKYKAIYEAGGNIMDAITLWEDEPGFALGPDVPGMDMVYTPTFWRTCWEDENYVYVGVADGEVLGWDKRPATVGGRYHASKDADGNLTCLAGDVAARYEPMSRLHANARAQHMTLDDIFTWCDDTVLMVVEYATMDTQNAIGQGVCNMYFDTVNAHPLTGALGTNSVILSSLYLSNAIPGAVLDIGTNRNGGDVASRVVMSAEPHTDTKYCVVTFSGAPVDISAGYYFGIHGMSNTTDAEIGSKSGFIGTDGRSIAYYRGRIAFGNYCRYVLGAYRAKIGGIWVAGNREEANAVDSLDTSRHTDTERNLPTGNRGVICRGFMGALHILRTLPLAPFAKNLSINNISPVDDYTNVPALSTGNTVLLAGGYIGTGRQVGRFANTWLYNANHSNFQEAALLFLIPPEGD